MHVYISLGCMSMFYETVKELHKFIILWIKKHNLIKKIVIILIITGNDISYIMHW